MYGNVRLPQGDVRGGGAETFHGVHSNEGSFHEFAFTMVANPCVGVEPPERGDGKRKTFIYPCEMAALLAFDEVPLEWREVYAITRTCTCGRESCVCPPGRTSISPQWSCT